MLNQFKQPRRVVITGMGCVTPIGIGREAFWNGLINGESGVRQIETFDVSASPVKIAAQVQGFDWEAQLNPKDRKHVPRTVPLALAAAREALADTNLQPDEFSLEQRRSFGVVLGTGGGKGFRVVVLDEGEGAVGNGDQQERGEHGALLTE